VYIGDRDHPDVVFYFMSRDGRLCRL